MLEAGLRGGGEGGFGDGDGAEALIDCGRQVVGQLAPEAAALA
ncbi:MULTISPECIES: hypothetical protein [Streptomyces]|nr:hypothetical protein [Streptomyces chartreusis]